MRKETIVYFSGFNPIDMMHKDFDMFWKFYVCGGIRTFYAKFTGRKLRFPIYAGHIVKTHEEGNKILKKMILSNTPFLFGRNGGNETLITALGVMFENNITEFPFFDLDTSVKQCGFFPNNRDSIIKFSHLIQEATLQSDIYGTFRWIMEDYLLSHYTKQNVVLTHANNMDFWRYKKPFTCALKGKRVLVVSPFAEQIKKQYENREKLFQDPDWLPEFELYTVKAVQTVAGVKDNRFSDWFEALDYMKNEVMKVDFDIALLGCGAYGMPLAAYIKQCGKQAIYVGGVLQMIFGIRGKRWDSIPEAASLYNDYWISIDKKDVPTNAEIVEGGCYW